MSLAYIPPYVTAGSVAGYDEPNDITDSIDKTVSDSGSSNMSDESTQTVGSSVTSVGVFEKDGYVRGEDSISQYMNEANTTGTSSTSSPASTRMSRRASGSQSPVSSVGDDCANEHVNHTKKDMALEQPNGTDSQHSPETIQIDPIDYVFARDLPALPSTVSFPRYQSIQCIENLHNLGNSSPSSVCRIAAWQEDT